MSNIAIAAEGLSKRYRIGTAALRANSLRQVMTDAMLAPVRNFAKLRRATSFTDQDDPGVFWALRDVSFEVKYGEVLGLIGHNGAGKSTLLKILSRITHPTTGHADIRGRVGSLLEVGIGFHPELTGRENVFLNGSVLGMDRLFIKDRFDEIVEFSGVERFIDTPVKRYSSGMYMRLAFAVAAHLEPEILIIDEVLSVGDAAFTRKCLGKVDDVAREGRTIVFVSHDMSSIESLCQQVILFEGGRMIRSGDPHTVINAYLNTTLACINDRHWPDLDTAPGDGRARLHSARVYPAGGAPGDIITVGDDVIIDVDCWNYVQRGRFGLALEVRTLEGTTAFTSYSVDDPRCADGEFPIGLCRHQCRIPGGLLNDATYRVRIAAITHDGDGMGLPVEDLLVFAVRDIRVSREGWRSELGGVLRPTLQWQTEYLGAESGAGGGSAAGAGRLLVDSSSTV
jgi:lipopolysaccharide transport system ATP-binding protein